MTKIEEIEKAVSALAEKELARFRDWFEKFDAALFDRKIERDAARGCLDRQADAALAEHRKGTSREI